MKTTFLGLPQLSSACYPQPAALFAKHQLVAAVAIAQQHVGLVLVIVLGNCLCGAGADDDRVPFHGARVAGAAGGDGWRRWACAGGAGAGDGHSVFQLGCHHSSSAFADLTHFETRFQ